MSYFLKMLILISFFACAHSIHPETSEFYQGVAHPLSGLDHFLVMLAIGIWTSQQRKQIVWLLPLSFTLCMSSGWWLGLEHHSLPFAEIGVTLSVVILGILLVGFKINTRLSMILNSIFATFYGHIHGVECEVVSSCFKYGAGLLCSTFLLYLLGLSLGWILNRSTLKRDILQVGGLTMALIGSMLLQAHL